MAERKHKYGGHCTFDAEGDNRYFVGQTPLGNYHWRVMFADGTRQSGHEANEWDALGKARAAAKLPTSARSTEPGAFARQHASTKSSRYGTIEPRPTFGGSFEHPELHLCAHGQRQVLCRGCDDWHCACPGSVPHQCSRAA